jgi:hypothetical protein
VGNKEMDVANSNFNNIELERIIAGAIKGDKASLDLLRFSPWFTKFLDKTSTWMAHDYGLDREEIRDAVFDKVSEKIHDITNPNNSPLTGCFCRWCKMIARTCCLNKLRHNEVEDDYLHDLKALETTHGSRISKEGASEPLQYSSTDSPEEIAFENEIARLCRNLKTVLYLAVKRELAISSPTDIRVVILWGGRMKLKQISEATDISISSVQRHLTEWQKGILEKTILHQIIDKEPARRAGAYELIRNADNEFTRAA